jgi:hypothetical protein
MAWPNMVISYENRKIAEEWGVSDFAERLQQPRRRSG